MDSLPPLNANVAKNILRDMLLTFKLPENIAKLEAAKLSMGNNMINYMQFVFPVMTQIQNEVIAKYGYPADGEGLIEFALAIKKLETEDSELCELNYQVRRSVMPPLDLFPDLPLE